MITTAYINIWNKRMGAVAWNPETGTGDFEFTPGFAANRWDLSPIKMPVASAKGRIFSFPENRNNETFKGLPGLLADSLPDRYGNTLINAWLAEQGRVPGSMNPVEMLCFIGKRGMGALEFEPVEPKGGDTVTKIEIDSLLHIAREVLSGKQKFIAKLSKEDEKSLQALLKIGTSAGGARAKVLIAYNPKTRELRSGQADAPKDFSHWILKLDGIADQQLGTSQGFGCVEMAYHLMALDCGIEMTECRLIEEHGRAHFMTRRFDRMTGDGKLQVQTFCALMHYDYNNITAYSYEQLFQTMRMLHLPYPQAEQMFRRMAFNVMARNCDDHTKNFAFIMDKTGEWKISPAYDVCFAYRPGSAWVSRHSLSINGKRENISRNDLLAVAKHLNLKKPALILDEIKNVVRNWKQYAGQTKVDVKLKEAIGKVLQVV